MESALVLSDESRTLGGILLIAFVTIETGGLYLVKLVRGQQPATAFQLGFARAGHAHAGVLVLLALVCQVFADATTQTGVFDWLSRSGVAVAAILMPAGFFFSSMGAGREQPNRLIGLVYAGALLLAAGVSSLGLGLLLS
ncbi:MAG: hypothetical protein M3510_01980 [Actinomycetota bacterium]|jgi:hypothetical protein|nr:hypothetical protein [Actinomycetota bacterium]